MRSLFRRRSAAAAAFSCSSFSPVPSRYRPSASRPASSRASKRWRGIETCNSRPMPRRSRCRSTTARPRSARCVAEEAFFRGFLQESLTLRLTPIRHGHLVAWLAASALFGIAHAGGGAGMVLLAAVAGLGYGWVYLRTRSLGAAVLAHFSLNAVHFLLLTYPRLY